MADDYTKDTKRSRALAPIGDYAVGYGKPPTATQFKKGQPSANPKGRPKKAAVGLYPVEGWTNGFHEMVIREGMRPIPVRDGNKVVTMPAAMAAKRATYFKAASGNAAAMRNVIAMEAQAQSVLREAKAEEIRAAMDYKRGYTEHARTCDQLGIDHGLEIHPDDVDINVQEGDVIVRGPMTPEEREMIKAIRECVQLLCGHICAIGEELREHPRRTAPLKRLKVAIEMLRRSNTMLPERYRIDICTTLQEAGLDPELAYEPFE